MGMAELLVIAVVALLFVGPDKLPDAAKKLSSGIRQFREQGRELKKTIQQDEHIGSMVRDLQDAVSPYYEKSPFPSRPAETRRRVRARRAKKDQEEPREGEPASRDDRPEPDTRESEKPPEQAESSERESEAPPVEVESSKRESEASSTADDARKGSDS